ncbi:MAG: hypothetical protein ACYC06_02105 [Ilumatobacteraceae bacterium]
MTAHLQRQPHIMRVPRRTRKWKQIPPNPVVWSFVLRYDSVSLYESAFKHKILRDDILHAHDYALGFSAFDSARGQARLLIVGPDRAGNLLDLIGIPRDEMELVVYSRHADASTFCATTPKGYE